MADETTLPFGDDVHSHQHKSSLRTPVPTDWQHTKILMARSLRKDWRKPKLWCLRTLAAPLAMMLYTLGFFLGYEDDPNNSTIEGDFRIHAGTGYSYPGVVQVAGFDADIVDAVALSLLEVDGIYAADPQNSTSFDDFFTACNETNFEKNPHESVCVYLTNSTAYHILFGGGESVTPFDSPLAGVQNAVDLALLNATGTVDEWPFLVDEIQKIPEQIEQGETEANPAYLLTIPIMQVLAIALASSFVMAPLTTEKIGEIVRSFVLVGVKLRTYMFSWILYFSLNGLVTAGFLTFVTLVWNLAPLSNGGLIFVSHYLGLVHLYSLITFLSQFISQEELAQGIPWLMAIASLVLSVTILVFQSPTFIFLTILSAISPMIGMVQYNAIYINYDSSGFDTGVHPGDNVASSGLLGVYVAQIVGILLCWACCVLYASPRFNYWVGGLFGTRGKVDTDDIGEDDDQERKDSFEPLPPRSEVLLSVNGVYHTFHPSLGKKLCSRDAAPNPVLKGLDMQICRGEVFSYLGHNGAGKTTSVNVLSGEIPLMEGQATFNFLDGAAELANPQDLDRIRSKIGVCPQHNSALLGDLTCRENLRLFARLKGRVKMENATQGVDEAVEAEVERRLDDIKFTSSEDADKEVQTYSGGMKRKVSIALALLGDPEIVYLDEPTAGMDPYNRRQIWDMIIAAKVGRSIILTTHFLDEADVLSDRVGVIKDGRLVTCGTTLFLKHHFGVGYSLRFNADEPIAVDEMIEKAVEVPLEKDGAYEWTLSHGTEGSFSSILNNLSEAGARNVVLALTTLEEVFLKTGQEDHADDGEETDFEDSAESPDPESQEASDTEELIRKVWQPQGERKSVGNFEKFLLIQNFMMLNAWKIGGIIFLNIGMPLIYLIAGFVVVALVDTPAVGEIITPEAIVLSPFVGGTESTQAFGFPDVLPNVLFPMQPTEAPNTIEDYFSDGALPITCGYFAENNTLQYNSDQSGFALQLGNLAVSTYNAINVTGSVSSAIETTILQLPYVTEDVFQVDFLVLPICLGFGFTGVAFTVLDVLLLKADNIVGLFRTAGATEWMTYMGVTSYKCLTTFLPFFILTIILGMALDTVLFGSAGRWLGTLLIMLGYAYSTTPIGLLLAKRFIHSDFKSVANWFPGVYMTFVSLPYVAWNVVLQSLPDARDAILIVGDILCIVPMVCFQRAIGAVIEISTEADDPDLTWGKVWSWESRVWYCILMMFVVGTLEWLWLYKLCSTRPAPTQLSEEEADAKMPVDISDSPELTEEKDRSHVDDEGINARELVKVFRVTKKGDSDQKTKKTFLKRAVKGVNYGVKSNEIFALLGPNGSGKTVSMNMLAAEYTPEHGEVALAGQVATGDNTSTKHLFENCDVSYCPQFDALFPSMTVLQHLRFYARIRGLDWKEEATEQHIASIVKLLGLGKHMNKNPTELSGGYKRRLSLGVAMVGYPKCMMVDECTTGMDPGARHLVWGALKPEHTPSGFDLPAILLSTHYMDEAAKLGSRIGIQIDGELVTAGSLDRLTQLYCTSYFVEISMRSDCNADSAEREVRRAFASVGMASEVYESLPYRFKLQIPFVDQDDSDHSNGTTTKQLADIFDLLESNKDKLKIKFYSVAQMNLEQIFIDLSRKQFAADEEDAPEQAPGSPTSARNMMLQSSRRILTTGTPSFGKGDEFEV